jgi:hypothetical protein
MKPFDLERALAGDPVVTRDGRPVEQIIRFKTEVKGQHTLYGVIDGYVCNWMLDGCRVIGMESSFDLFMASVKRGGWINIYPTNISQPGRLAASDDIYESKDVADRTGMGRRIACVYVEWEE